jgi:hypothetical protein
MSISNNPPTEYFDGIKYNPAFFPTNSGISLAYGTANYLSRVGTASSVASTTTFSGVVNANGGLGVTGGETVDTLNATTSLSVGGANINTIYQTIAGMSSYLTTAIASSTYQTIAGMSSYLTTATASSTYQTIAGMSSYLTTATASSTYQTISGMSSYLTTATASSTYQTIAGMSSYLTTATASSTYQTIAGMVNYALLASPTFTGIPTAPTATTGTTGTQIATCDFVLNNSTNILPLTNTFTGASNTFNNTISINGLDTSTEIVGFNNFVLTSIGNNQIYN